MCKKHNRRRVCAAAAALMLLISSAAGAAQLSEENAASIQTAITLTETDLEANSSTIRILLERCIGSLPEDDPAAAALNSVILLLDTGAADAVSVTTLLRNLVDSQGEGAEEQTAPAGPDTAADETGGTEESAADPGTEESVPDSGVEQGGTEETAADTGSGSTSLGDLSEWVSPAAAYGLPVYEVTSLIRSVLRDRVLVEIPGDWGSNESGRALTSYSPVNRSGAISPKAGTLTFSYFDCESQSEEEALEDYERNISRMSVTTGMVSEDVTTTDLPARKLDFTMSVGANQFLCETVCFAYESTIYTIELMQGMQSAYDYFPAYQDILESAEVGDAETIAEALSESEAQPQIQPESEVQPQIQPESDVQPQIQPESDVQPQIQPESDVQPQIQPESEVQPQIQPESDVQLQIQPEGSPEYAGDIGSFRYRLNGHEYQFPTAVSDIAPEDLQLDRDLELPYDFNSDADMTEGSWTEIVNTQYYYFENSLYKEMAGVTNMSGYPIPMTGGILTALIDTNGDYVDIELPGSVKVGSPESSILQGFPEFAGVQLDGLAHFRGNELLYAANVRDDGCNGYVLIRNDEPYYSAVSIICDGGVIREISYECIGSVRAEGVFL